MTEFEALKADADLALAMCEAASEAYAAASDALDEAREYLQAANADRSAAVDRLIEYWQREEEGLIR